jgi:Tfp pilus assembly protein PilZ
MSFALKRFGRRLGRRVSNRFVVPGAAVSWVSTGQDSDPNMNWPLSDIGRGGLSLLTNNPPAVGSEISLLVLFPKKPEPVELSGSVIYSVPRGPRLTYRYRVGVRFEAFAQSGNCNSLKSLSVIEELERTYGKRGKG